MNTQQLIKKLQSSNLFAECSCGGEFKLSDTVLFDGAKSFPTEALKVQNELNEELKRKEDELKKSKLAIGKATITAESVNIGKKLETILPIMKQQVQF